MNKKALELSINAIVILIMAIAALGLGIYFIRGSIEKARFQAEGAVKSTEIKANPTKDNPVALSPPTIDLRKNEQGKAVLYFMNPGESVNYCSLAISGPDGKLVEDAESSFKNSIVYAAKATEVEPDKISTWTIAIDTSASGFAQDQQYMFTNMIYCSDKITMDGIMGLPTPAERAITIANDPGIVGRFQKNLLVKIKK